MKTLEIDTLFSRDSLYNRRKYIPMHYHRETELYYLSRGRIKYFVDNQTFILNEGDLIIIPKHILHSTDSEECLYNERLLLSFGDEYLLQNTEPYLQELFNRNIIRIPKENRTLIENMFYKIENEYVRKKKDSNILIKLYINELILYLHRYRILNDFAEQKSDSLMQQIIQYINLNFEKEITLSKLCRIFGLSESHLSKRFKSSTGTCLSEYINYIRVSHAEQLLKSEHLPITEVAMRCGFNDSSYFSSVFKKFKGITPHKFSKNAFKNY